MPYLGYDRPLLTALRRALHRSSDQLAGLCIADVEALDAISTIRSCRATLDDQWLPVLDGLLGCVAMEGRSPTALDPADLRLALMIDRQHVGWTITTDPLAQSLSDTITTAEARAIGVRLLDQTAVDELTDDELVWLAGRLRDIAGDSAATAAFRTAFDGEADWATIIDRLGIDRAAQADRAVWDADNPRSLDRIAHLDTVITPLAALYAAGPHTSHAGPWSPTVIDLLDPYSAALLLRELNLDPNVAARAAQDVLTRSMQRGDVDRRWVDLLDANENAADLLFVWLATDPVAARSFVTTATATPERLFMTANDDRSVMAVLAAGTDPRVMSVADAGRTIPPLVQWAATHDGPIDADIDGGVDNIRSVIAGAISPWLMQLTSRPGDWSWSADEADRALRWTLDDQRAAEQLAAATAGWQQVLVNTRLIDDRGVYQHGAVDDLAQLFAIMQTRLRDAELDDAADAGLLADNAMLFASIVVSAVVPGGPAASMLTDLTLAVVSPAAERWLQRSGVLPSAGGAAGAAASRYADRSTATQVIALVAAVGQMIDAGKLPDDALDGLDLDQVDTTTEACAPQAMTDHLQQYLDDLPPTTDPLTIASLRDVVYAFGNAQSAAQQCDV